MLSISQQQAVEHLEGPCLTLAGPGSGKTLCLTNRIRYLIKEGEIQPDRILVITFTKAAAMEMKERFSSLMGESAPVVFGTFHSVFYGMLRQEKQFAKIQLMEGKYKRQILREVFVATKVSVEEDSALEDLEREISYIKNTMISPEDYAPQSSFGEDIKKLFEHYEARKAAYHLFDFDDMLSKTLYMLQNNLEFRTKWQKRFQYILIDEIQDMNQLQFESIRILALPENNLFIVGDDDQSIYGFRGAKPELMMRFSQYYPENKQILLGDNYRCGQNIVAASLRLIEKNKKRFAKEIVAKNDTLGTVEYLNFEDEMDEAQKLCERIIKSKQEGVVYEQIAVLFRNHIQCHRMVEGLTRNGNPFYLKEKIPNIYGHEIMLDLISYLRLNEKVLHRRDLFRIMNRPNRYLARASVEREWTTFEAWKRYYKDQDWMAERILQLERDVAFMSKLSGVGAIMYIRKKIGYDDFWKEKAASAEEFEDYLNIVDQFMDLARGAKNINQLIENWENARAYMEKLNQEISKHREQLGVGLFTMHTSKGLEFQEVYILDCNEGVVPSKKAKEPEQIEEERRLFYVAMTRAKERLCLCQVQSYQGKKISPSRFLAETEGAKDVD